LLELFDKSGQFKKPSLGSVSSGERTGQVEFQAAWNSG
jgi:hypothetical protein